MLTTTRSHFWERSSPSSLTLRIYPAPHRDPSTASGAINWPKGNQWIAAKKGEIRAFSIYPRPNVHLGGLARGVVALQQFFLDVGLTGCGHQSGNPILGRKDRTNSCRAIGCPIVQFRPIRTRKLRGGRLREMVHRTRLCLCAGASPCRATSRNLYAISATTEAGELFDRAVHGETQESPVHQLGAHGITAAH